MPFTLLLILVVLIVGYFGISAFQRRQHINRLLSSELTSQQRDILHAQIPLLHRLPKDLHPALEGKINRFLDQVDMHGCEGLELTEEIELSIAGQACLLIVNSNAWYKTLRTVLVYPAAFKSIQQVRDGYVVREVEVVRLGESWAHGPVILSWADSHQGAQNDRDGKNVVLHEFAHQLDALSGHVDGVPILNRRQSFAEWEHVFLDAFDRHQSATDHGVRTVIDAYGAQNHQEFLAVAVELFFERPKDLKKVEPALYQQLSLLLGLDPATWTI